MLVAYASKIDRQLALCFEEIEKAEKEVMFLKRDGA